jgi:hypothetical protein
MATLPELVSHARGVSSSEVTVWRLTGPLLCAAATLFGLLLWLFWDGIYREWRWWQGPDYGYAFLIPPLSLFLIWQ